MKKRVVLVFTTLLLLTAAVTYYRLLPTSGVPGSFSPLSWGAEGANVKVVQTRLQELGYFSDPVDGIFDVQTADAVQQYQEEMGLAASGAVEATTWASLLGLEHGEETQPVISRAEAAGVSGSNDVNLLSRLVAAEAEGEPYRGQVAVAAVILNRVKSPKFPNNLSGVVHQPHAFESVTNGLVWRRTPDATAVKAARDAINGYDPTYGCIFFWNPSKPISSKWIWSRSIVARIGKHVFAK